VSSSDLHCCAAALGSAALEEEHHNSIAAFEELLRLNDHFFKRREKVFKGLSGFLAAATCLGNGTSIWRLQFEVRVRVTKDGIPVSATDGLVLGAKRLNVCL